MVSPREFYLNKRLNFPHYRLSYETPVRIEEMLQNVTYADSYSNN